MNPREVRDKADRKYTLTQSRQNIRNFCIYRERSQYEVRQRLYEYGLSSIEVDELISELIQENYLNEERFARAFVRGKFTVKKWGRVKIKNELYRHQLSDYILNAAFEEIDEDFYNEVLGALVDKKNKEVKEKNAFRRNGIIARSLINRGFESDMVWEKLRNRDN